MADKSKSTTLGDVPFFNRLIGSTEGDPIVGEDELGNPVYLNQRTKVRYTLDKVGKKGDLTARGKASELVKQTKKWFKDPTVSFKPKAIAEGVKQAVEQTPNVARSVAESFDKTVRGEGTYGETFGLAAIPAAPISRVPEGALRTFGGMSSVRELVEKGKISLDEVEHVTSLIERGVRPETLWGETGRWFIGKDGQLRIELDDSAMELKPALYDNASDRIRRNDTMGESDWLTTFELEDSLGEKLNYERLEDLIDHKELFDAYPSLKDMKVYLDGGNRKRYKNSYGVYREGTDDIVLNLNRIGYKPDDVKETLIHEVQHAIQKRENFARGATPESAIVKNHPEYKAAVTKADKAEKELQALLEKHKDILTVTDEIIFVNDKNFLQTFDDAYKKVSKANKDKLDLSFEIYRRVYGEEEANAVAQRLHMTAGERAEQFPEFNYRGSRTGDKKPESIIHGVKEKPRGFAASAPREDADFKKWFEDSKVVDKTGQPMIMYHGTVSDIQEFRTPSFFTANPDEASAYTFSSKARWREKHLKDNPYQLVRGDAGVKPGPVPYIGIISDIPLDAKAGEVWATDQGVIRLGKKDPNRAKPRKVELLEGWVVDYKAGVSDDFSKINIKKGDGKKVRDIVSDRREFIDERVPKGTGVGGNVHAVYLSIKNPIELSPLEANRLGARLEAMTPEEVEDYISNLKAQGFDGIATWSDEGTFFDDIPKARQYIPFEASQIKNVFDSKSKRGFAASVPKLNQDLGPNDEWLKGKVKRAKENRKEYGHEGGTLGNLGGTEGVTGWFETPVELDPKALKDVKGLMGEETFRRSGKKLDDLKTSIAVEGYKPNPILIHVREDGVPFITEGNHRLAEAIESGRNSILVEIKYLRGGQNAEGLLNPNNLPIPQKEPRGFAAGGYASYSDPRMEERGRTAPPSQTQSKPSLSFGGSKAPSTPSVPTSRPTLSFNQPSKSSPARSEPSYTPDHSYDPMSPSLPRGSKPSGDIAGAFGFKSPTSFTTVSRPTVKTNGSGLLDYIRASEAEGSYDIQTYYATKAGIKPPKALTSMLVSEVRDYQNLLSSKGIKSTAMGGYQVMGYTLQSLIDQGVVKPSDVFDKTTQDKIGMALLERRGLSKYQSGQMPESDFLKGLSQEWAAFPVTTKMVGHLGTMLNPGDSYYKGLAGNEATVSVNDFISTVRGIPKGQIPTLPTRPVPRPVIGMVGGVKKAGGHWQPFGSKGLAHQANLDYTDASQHLRKVSFDKEAIGPNAVYLGKRGGKDLWAAHDYERDEAGNYIAGSALKAANLASSIPGGTVATQAELANLYKNPLTQHIPMPLHPEGKTWDKATKAEYDRLLPSFDPTRPVVHGKEFYASEPEQLASARTSGDVRYASDRPQLTFPTVTRSTKTLPTPKETVTRSIKTLPTPKETETTAPKVRPQPRPYEVKWEPRANPEAIAKAKVAILEKIPEEDLEKLDVIGLTTEDLTKGVEKALGSAADVEVFVRSKLELVTQKSREKAQTWAGQMYASLKGKKPEDLVKEFSKEETDAIVNSVINTGLVGNKAVRIPGTEPKVTEQLPIKKPEPVYRRPQLPAKKPEPVYRRPQLPVKSKAPLVPPRPTSRPKTEDDVPRWAKADWLREADKFLLSFVPDWMKGGELIKPRTEEPAERKTRKDLYCYHDQLSGEYICNYPDHEHENSVLPRMDYTPGASAFNEGGLVTPTFTGEYTNFGRPVWERNGNRYSEKSITIGIDDGFVVVPTVGPEGEDIPFETILEYLDNYGLVDPVTGEELPVFTSEATANKYAKERSDNMFNPIWEFKEEE